MSRNGRLIPDELAPVQAGVLLATTTATAWRALVDDVRADTGVTLRISPNGGYRSLADQRKLSGKGNHQYTPGHSVHGYGTCVDIANWQAVGDIRQDRRLPGVRWYSARLDELAARRGFHRTYTGALWEPWHYQHSAPTPIGDEIDMATIAELQQILDAHLASAKDAIRRESRGWRLFRNTDRPGADDEFVAVNWSLPIDDPRKVIHLNAREATSLRQNYLMTADTTANAHPLPATALATLERLAQGTDQVYTAAQ